MELWMHAISLQYSSTLLSSEGFVSWPCAPRSTQLIALQDASSFGAARLWTVLRHLFHFILSELHMDLRVWNPDKSTQKHRGTFGKMMEHVWTWTMSSCHPISIYHSYIIYIQSDVDKCMINIIYHFISVSVHRYRQPCWPLGWDGSLRHGWGEPMQIRARVLARPRYNRTTGCRLMASLEADQTIQKHPKTLGEIKLQRQLRGLEKPGKGFDTDHQSHEHSVKEVEDSFENSS